MTPPPIRRVRLLWWGLVLFVAAIFTGLAGGYGVARLDQPSATDPAGAGRAEPTVAASSPAAAAPTTQPEVTACVRGFDIYDGMHDAYLDGVDFAESRRTAAEQLRALADLYPEPDRTYLIDFSEVLAADAQVAGEDPDAVREALDREGDAWLEFTRLAC